MSRRAALVLLALASGIAAVAWSLTRAPAPIPRLATDLHDMVLIGPATDDDAFWIDRFEVTEAQWEAFAARRPEVGRRALELLERRAPDYPIRFVTCDEAAAFAAAASKRLPSNEEWERAARGPGGGFFPWGDGYLPAANTHEAWSRRAFVGQGVTRVGTFPRGRSPDGVHDLVGNVWEWTRSGYREALHDPRLTVVPNYDADEDRLLHVQDLLRARLDHPLAPEIPPSFSDLVPQRAARGAANDPVVRDMLEESLGLVERRLALIREWKERNPEYLRVRVAEATGERHRIVRGGSFRTRVRGLGVDFEELERCETRSWDIGFRCVVAAAEIRRQERILPLIADLAYRDPVNVLLRVRPARSKLVAQGVDALPYLRRLRELCRLPWLCERVDAIIAAIGEDS